MTSTIDASSPNEPVIVITRMFAAPRELVWRAITDPKHVAQWYGGQGFTSPVCEMDVRPGGTWRHVMQAPNGPQFAINSVFLEVVEPERLVWTTANDVKRNPPPPTSVTTVTLEVHGVTDADPLGNEPLFDKGGKIVGRATSGYYGHTLRKSLAIGYAKAEFAAVGTELEIEILGERKKATVVQESPYDPDNKDLRA